MQHNFYIHIKTNNFVFEDISKVIFKFLGVNDFYVPISILGQLTNNLHLCTFAFYCNYVDDHVLLFGDLGKLSVEGFSLLLEWLQWTDADICKSVGAQDDHGARAALGGDLNGRNKGWTQSRLTLGFSLAQALYQPLASLPNWSVEFELFETVQDFLFLIQFIP